MRVDKLSFSVARERAIAESNATLGIGTYGEKLLHRTLKYYFEPDESKHEISCYGSVADIRNDEGIIEIQTRSFGKLVPKLERFLPESRVIVVYPVIESKTVCRIDTETGESRPPRKSPKRGRASDALAEISMIRRFIPDERLSILIVMVDVTETRMLNGKRRIGRKRTAKINCIPDSVNSVIMLTSPEDYLALVPKGLSDGFTADEFERISGLHGIGAHGALMLLLQLSILRRERRGREHYRYYFDNNSAT